MSLVGNVLAMLAEYESLRAAGTHVTPEEFCRACPSMLGPFRQGMELLGSLGSGTAAPVVLPGYDIEDELGRGGMGVVYKARDRALDRIVAVKLISATVAHPELLARFRGEAEAAARLRHPNVVGIHHVGEVTDRGRPCPFLVLEYVDGHSLAVRLALSPLAPRDAAALVAALAGAMQHAHEAGVIHRDLKPGNVLLAGDTLVPKVTDFGLARLVDAADGPTRSGDVMGTPSYMSPEQAAGRTKEVGPRSDQYALGAILYECLTGRPPFRAAGLVETLRQVQEEDPVPPRTFQPSVPRDLELICLKCLEKSPARRYADCRELGEELRRFLADEPLAHTRAVSRLEKTWRWARRHPLPAALLGVATVLFVAVVGVSVAYGVAANRFAREQGEAAGRLTAALGESEANARTARARAEDARRERERAERQSVGLILDRGIDRCRSGQVAAGLLTLAEALEVAERSGAPDDLKRVIRANLAAWRGSLRAVTLALPHQAGEFTSATRPAVLGRAALVVSPDGSRVFTCRDREGQVYDARTGDPVGRPVAHDKSIFSAAFGGPDGRTLATGSADGTARVWDAATGEPRTAPLGHSGTVFSVAFSPDGTTLLAADGATVRRWNAATGAPVGNPLAHRAEAVAWGTAGLAVSGGPGVGGRLWNWDTDPPAEHPLGAANSDSSVVAFSPDGKRVLTGRLWVQVYGAADGSPGKSYSHPSTVWDATFSPDGRRVLSACLLGSAAVWSAESGALLGQPGWGRAPKGIGAVGYRPDGRQYLLGCTDGRAQVFDAQSHQQVGPPLTHDSPVLLTRFTPDGRGILTLDNQSTARLWEADPPLPAARPHPGPVPPRPAHRTRTVQFVLDGNTTTGTQVIEAGKPVGPVVRHRSRMVNAAVSPDGTRLATASLDSTAGLWEVGTGREVARLQHGHFVAGVAFSPDSRRLLTTSSDGTARIWDAVTGRSIGAPLEVGGVVAGPFGGHNVPHARFSEDGTLAVTVGVRGVEVWDADTGRPIGPPVPVASTAERALTADGLLWQEGGTVRCLSAPVRPVPGSAARVKFWAEVVTGQRLGPDGEASGLSAADWAEARRRLSEAGGPP